MLQREKCHTSEEKKEMDLFCLYLIQFWKNKFLLLDLNQMLINLNVWRMSEKVSLNFQFVISINCHLNCHTKVVSKTLICHHDKVLCRSRI